MKPTRILMLFLSITVFLTLTAFESDRDFEISVGNDYVYCYYDQSFSEITDRLNEIYMNGDIQDGEKPYTTSSLKSYFKENDIRFFAVNKKNPAQIRVAVYSDEVSETIQNLSEKSNKFVKKFGKDLVGDTNQKYEIYYRDARKYVKISNKETDNGGEYYVTQFITVCNGEVFNISFFGDKGITAKEKKILDTFEVKEATIPSKKPVYIVIVCAVSIALLVCLVVYMLWGLIMRARTKLNGVKDCGLSDSQNDNDTDDEEVAHIKNSDT